jgi:demethylmenaquinone methyltransferase/2-methoxy-6-polyprenyl-1,4-benzoquinol methylase
MHRVLKKGGRALILEFSLPKKGISKTFYLLYLRHFVPLLGALIARDYKAYRYLNQTIETFPYGEDFNRMMQEIGFTNIKANQLTDGIATIYQGDKP